MAAAPSREVAAGSGELEGPWGPLGVAPPPLPPLCAHQALPAFGWLRAPPLGLIARQASARCQVRPLPWPCAPLPLPLPCAPLPLPLLLLRPEEGPSVPRGKGCPSRESTAALKAWLGRHPRNPYPSKGEKVLLALVSRMSLTQVSTWFANARRRLKKENRACWGGRTPREGEGEGEQEEEEEAEEEEEEEEGESAGEADPQGSPQPRAKTPTGPASRLPTPATTEPPPPRPKIWRLAEFATGHQPQRPVAQEAWQ